MAPFGRRRGKHRMRHLLVVRHGHAAAKSPGGSDRDRPLTPEGRSAVEALAARLAAESPASDLALSSSARRARETLEILLEKQPGVEVELEDSLYLADARSLLHRLRELPADAGTALLVGHNPGLQELATFLAAREHELLVAGLPPAGACLFAVEGEWSRLSPASARLRAYFVP